MRLAVLGDIHANAPALKAVLDAVRQHGVDGLLLTGDYIGYYYWPAEVLDLLSPWKQWAIRGNHDRMLAPAATDAAYLARCTESYGSGLKVALDELTPPHKQWLAELPDRRSIELDGCTFLLAHGSPWDPDEYIYPTAPDDKWERIARESEAESAQIALLAHTHYRLVRQQGNTLIVNAGSVGQPRDRQPGASWALVDTATRSAQLMNESYDLELVASEARRRDPQLPYLHEVLFRT